MFADKEDVLKLEKEISELKSKILELEGFKSECLDILIKKSEDILIKKSEIKKLEDVEVEDKMDCELKAGTDFYIDTGKTAEDLENKLEELDSKIISNDMDIPDEETVLDIENIIEENNSEDKIENKLEDKTEDKLEDKTEEKIASVDNDGKVKIDYRKWAENLLGKNR